MRSLFVLLVMLPLYCPAINVTLMPFHDACGNGTGRIAAQVSGGMGPFQYVWGPGTPIGQGTNQITGLFAGTYTLTVTDALAEEITVSTTINTLPTLYPGNPTTGWATSCNMQCNGSGSIPVFSWGWGGQSPYSVAVSDGGNGTVQNNALYVSGLCPGTVYNATVTDALGCTSEFSGIQVDDLSTPVILDVQVSGSCEGGATGTVVVTLDQPFSTVGIMTWFGSTNYYYADQNGVAVLNNMEPGSYSATAYPHLANGNPPGGGPCGALFVIDVPISAGPCGTVSGMVHVDLDGDCIMNADDVHFPHCVLMVAPDQYAMSSWDGTYQTALFYGNHTITTNVDGYTPICPATLPAPFTLNAMTPNAVVDIAMAPLAGPDMMALCGAGTPRPGFPLQYSITARNNGPHPHGPFTATFTYDALLIYDQSSIPPDFMAPGSLEFNLPGLSAWQQLNIQIGFDVPPDPLLIGTSITATATVLPVPADDVPANDSYTVTRMIVGAYDPNDKLARTSSAISDGHYFVAQDQFIDYTIRFQNTGNADAIHVHLIDTIAAGLDLGSLQVLGASHDYEVQLLPGRVLRFDFPDIMLPDSTSNELGSQGSATFRIRPANDILPGDVLENFADIYFDFNPPIRTNTSQLVVETSTSTAPQVARPRVLAWPNPVAGQVHIRLDSSKPIDGWRMFDALGRTMAGSAGSGQMEMVSISCEGMPAGAYVIEVISAEGSSFARVVKGE